jgi:hypothetical protein
VAAKFGVFSPDVFCLFRGSLLPINYPLKQLHHSQVTMMKSKMILPVSFRKHGEEKLGLLFDCSGCNHAG